LSYHLLYEEVNNGAYTHRRAALFDDGGRLLTLRFDDPSRPLTQGTVVWGKVDKVAGGLGAAFVDIGDTLPGVLGLHTLPHGVKLTEGSKILCRVTRGGFSEKGARLDARVAPKPPAASTLAPTIIKPAPPALVRALHDAGQHPVTVWIPDVRLHDVVKAHVPERLIRTLDEPDAPELFETLDEALDTIVSRKPTFTFKGGNIIAEMTSAVATIDVNSPLSSPAGMARNDAILNANLNAAEEIVRVCRLMDLGGSVIVDFITPGSKAHRDLITEHLRASFATADETDVEIRPMSRHGLVELNRVRTGPSLPLLLAEPPFEAARILLELVRTAPGGLSMRHEETLRVSSSVASVLKPLLSDAFCVGILGRRVKLS